MEQNYMTDGFVEDRAPIMQQWANHLSRTMGAVISKMPDVQREKRESLRVQKYNVLPITEAEYQIIAQNILKSRQQGEPDQDILRGAVVIAAIGLMRDSQLAIQKTVSVQWRDLHRERDGTARLTTPFSKKNRHGRKKPASKKSGRGDVTYVSARVMAAIEEMRRIRHKLGLHVADDERIFQTSVKKLRSYIKEACVAAGLEGNFSGYSPRNGMEQDLGRARLRRRCHPASEAVGDTGRKDGL